MGFLASLVLAAAAADGNVAEGAATGPVSLAGLAEVARLREAVVIVVAELCVCRIAARALERRRAGVLLRGSRAMIESGNHGAQN